MSAWEARPAIPEDLQDKIREVVTPFEHTPKHKNLVIAGVDGSGDYPALSYADSFVYISTATATTYESDSTSGLREVGPQSEPLIDFAWLPESNEQRTANIDAAFSRLVGVPIESVLEQSDYLQLKGMGQSVSSAVKHLVRQSRPHWLAES